MSSSVQLRQAESRDVDGIHAVHTRAILELCRSSYSEESVQIWAARQKPHQYLPFIEKAEITVAVSAEGEVVGFGHLISCRSTEDGDTSELKGLFVSPQLAGKGVGSCLQRHLEQQAAEKGHRNMCVKSSKNAVGFYEKMGFSVVYRDGKHVCADQTLQCILMNKVL